MRRPRHRASRSRNTERPGNGNRIPRFADPWFMRRRLQVPVQQIPATPAGAYLEFTCVRRGHEYLFVPRSLESATQMGSRPGRPMLAKLRRRKRVTMVRYRREGRCTSTELRTIEALWGGMPLRQFARVERIAPQAVTARINGLANKASEFYRWWRLKNLNRFLRKRRS